MAKKILIGIVALVAIFFGVGFILPAKISIEHSTQINAPATAVFEQLNNMEKTLAWDPWAAADPTMKVEIGSIKSGVGASKSWTSESSGNGSQTITESVPDSSVKADLDFKDQGTGKAWWKLEASNGGTLLTQGFSSEMTNIVGRYMGNLFMKGIVGARFEQGHQKIKEIVEAK
jgi:hypothetical protein